MGDMEIPNFYRVNKCTIKPPKPELLPPGIHFEKNCYEIDLRKFKHDKPRRQRPRYNRWNRKDHCTEKSVNHKWNYRLILNFRHYKALSWREYKLKVLLGRKKVSEGIQALYEGNVKPLCHKTEMNSPLENSNFKCYGSKSNTCVSKVSDVIYDVHLPNSNYKRTADCQPDLRIIIYSAYNSYPTLSELFNESSMFRDEVPLYAALVDHGKVHFYSQHHIRLPHLP
ncbi:hypothetical protein GQR58_020803 [Nymphon striatum]|nr:hypothetical protein GQR58_020803 [Nymphon striatum]